MADLDAWDSFSDDEVLFDDSAEREYDIAPRDVHGVHDTDGMMLVLKKGESLPFTSRYKRKGKDSKLVKFYVNKNLQCEVIARIDAPNIKKRKTSEISHEKGDGAGKQSPQLSSPSEKSSQSSQLSVTSEEAYSGDDGDHRAGTSRDAGEKKSPQSPGDCAGKKLRNHNEFVAELYEKFDEKVIGGIEASLRLTIKQKFETDDKLNARENNAIVNSVIQCLSEQYGPARPDQKLCDKLAELLRCKFQATFKEKYVVNSDLGNFDLAKTKGEGGHRALAIRIGEQFYNRIIRPTIKKPADQDDQDESEEPEKKKGKYKKTYMLNQEKWELDKGATMKEKREAQEQFIRFCEAESDEERKDALLKSVVHVQKFFRVREPSQVVEDLNSFWQAGPEILSFWFEWLVDGSKDGHLATTVDSQLNKVLNLIEAYIKHRRGEEAERDLARIKKEAREANGCETYYQLHLIRALAKVFRNKAEMFIYIDGEDDDKSGPDETLPNMYITKRDTHGVDDYPEKIVMNLRIGHKIIWEDLTLPQAIAGVTQLYFSFNLMYPPDIDDILQFNERIMCNFGTDDGARNPKQTVKKCFREFTVTYESLKILRYFNPMFSGILWFSSIEI